MGRSFLVAVARAARAAERANRSAIREREQAARSAQRAYLQSVRANDRASRLAAKEAEPEYHQSREAEAEELTGELALRVELLQGILTPRPRTAAVYGLATIDADAACERAFASMRHTYSPARFSAESVVGPPPSHPDPTRFQTGVPKPSFVGKLFGGQSKYERVAAEARARDEAQLTAAQERFRADVEAWEIAVRAAHTP